ncbi:nuclear envelope integral membrane protein [Bombus vancouverensis nearcticus]|uniref:Nuclear envelope integral membrane protein 1 n=1 Tax=Bombus bifarius TaxID=103933 RepID=A0A6P8M7E2_9HYME|nr:nuclear envelope integral membrane protein 1 [Bombus bifarius]
MDNGIVNPLSAVIFLLIFHCVYTESPSTTESIHFLKPGDVIENNKPGLQTFCHSAKPKHVRYMWGSLTIYLRTNIENYDLYNGKTPEEVMQMHDDNHRSWNFNIFSIQKNKKFKINPFEDVCIGIYVHPSNLHKYTVSMIETRTDSSILIMMMAGAALFLGAYNLSKNTLFYYLISIMLGITTSIIILVYFISKFLLKGKMMYITVLTGWTMSFYLFQMLWENTQLIIVQYREWVAWYILITSVISFVISYRFGPITNVRTKRLIQWFLQIIGLITMYYSSYLREASAFFCILILLLYKSPTVLTQKGRTYWMNMFPERRKLLTEDQYREEGIRETNKALNELKEYCVSPKCNPWKTTLILKDPIRFARFMEGESHLSEGESREHDAEITRIIEECEYTDDEDDTL